MKKIFTLFFLTGISASVYAQQTLFTYGNYTVTTDEFLRAYNKNKIPVENKENSMREYLDLYANFKLKVQAAKELRLDTLQQIRSDIMNFRSQVEENYMSDENAKNILLHEAIDRAYKDLHILHFSVAVDSTMSFADTARAYSAIHNVYEQLKKGNDVMKAVSNNEAKIRYSDVGYITAFSLPYNFENIVYALKPGETSKPYRTKSAWHVFRLVDVRPATGKWKVAQILFSRPPEADVKTTAAIMKQADSVYRLLQNGAEFSIMAREFSQDKLTYMTGGELPEFSTGKYEPSFETEVIKLKNDGDISKPFSTAFGIHIIKRLGHTPMPVDRNEAAMVFDMKQKILKDSRIEASRQQFSKKIMDKVWHKKSAHGILSQRDMQEVLRYADTVMKDPFTDNSKAYPISSRTFDRFAKRNITGEDWLKFVKEYKGNYDLYKGETNRELWDKFLVYSGERYYKDHLEEYNDDFKYQMKEFEEGNMLFEIMERNVWGVAGNDSAGLMNHYLSNRNSYLWPASAEVIIINSNNEKAAEKAMQSLKNGTAWKDLVMADNIASVQADSGRYELAQLTGVTNGKIPDNNTYSSIIRNSDGTATFIKFLRLYPAGQQRTFEEAKGLVINDYQKVLEDKWLASLKKKYPVQINQAAFRSIVKQ